MKCSHQSVYKFDQASLQIESGCETGKFVLVQERCAFQAHTTRDHKSYRFNKVREMINNLIAQPKEEALEDAEHKDLCDTELTTNTQARKEKTATVENLHATVNELKTSMEKFGTGSDETLRPGVSSSRRTRRHAGRTPSDERFGNV